MAAAAVVDDTVDRCRSGRPSTCGFGHRPRQHKGNSMMPDITESHAVEQALERRLKRLGLTSDEDDWTDRYLLCENAVDPVTARSRQRFEAVARFIRDLITHRWVKTRLSREEANPKRIYYLSMEF